MWLILGAGTKVDAIKLKHITKWLGISLLKEIDNCLCFNFNNKKQIKIKLNDNLFDKILFDESTVKFIDWNYVHLINLSKKLKIGGKILIPYEKNSIIINGIITSNTIKELEEELFCFFNRQISNYQTFYNGLNGINNYPEKIIFYNSKRIIYYYGTKEYKSIIDPIIKIINNRLILYNKFMLKYIFGDVEYINNSTNYPLNFKYTNKLDYFVATKLYDDIQYLSFFEKKIKKFNKKIIFDSQLRFYKWYLLGIKSIDTKQLLGLDSMFLNLENQ